MTEIVDTFTTEVRKPISSLKVGSVFRSNSSNSIYIKVADCEYYNMTSLEMGDLSDRFSNYVLATKVEVRYD